MTTRYEVVLTADATQDLQELYDYVAEHDAPLKAEQLLNRIETTLDGLASFPERGAHTKELVAIGMHEYRETYFKPYRLIYRVVGKRVYVYLIVDGRRDMQTLLQKRMLRN